MIVFPLVVIVGTKIARSRDLGVITRLSKKCYQNVGYVEKTELSAPLNA